MWSQARGTFAALSLPKKALLTTISSMASMKVLLVEDQADLRLNLSGLLSDLVEDVSVITAANGMEALQLIDSHGVDLVLTDLSMPELDGHELIRRLRSRLPEVPVVVLTGDGNEETVVRCLQAGACDYLVKPVRADDLVVATANALHHRPAVSREVEVEFDPNGWFELAGPSDYGVLYRYRKFLSLMKMFDLEDDVANDVLLAIEEIGRNAIEWGNRGDTRKKIRLGIRVMPQKIMLQVADEGDGFTPAELPDPSKDPLGHINERLNDGKRIGAFGIHLIRSLMDKVLFNAKGNVVIAIKYLGSPVK